MCVFIILCDHAYILLSVIDFKQVLFLILKFLTPGIIIFYVITFL